MIHPPDKINPKKINNRRIVLIAGVVAALIGAALGVWYVQNTAGITTFDPSNPPPPILDAAELAKLELLQNPRQIFILSDISPDDSTVLIAEGSTDGSSFARERWLDIQTGETELIAADILNLFPQSEVVWSDNQTVMYVSLNQNSDPVVVTLDRSTGELVSQDLPLIGRVLSLAPNGSRVLVEVGAEGGIDLLALTLETGKSQKLLHYPSGSALQSIAWSADGSKLAVINFEIEPNLVDDQKKINELVTQDALGNLPLTENPMFMGNVVHLFDLTEDQPQPQVLHTDPDDGYLFNQVALSPSGDRLLTRMIRPTQPAGRANPVVVVGVFPDRAFYRIYDAELNFETTLDRPEIEAPLASHAMFISSDEVLVVAAYQLNMGIYHFDLRSGEFRALPTGDGTFSSAPHREFQVYATHSVPRLIYNQSSFEHPEDIYRLDLDSGAPEALTHFNDPIAAANHIRVDEISIELKDGSTRVGYLLQPADASFPPQNVPIVLYQQGGPGGAMTNRWGATADEPFNLLPNYGIAVLFMPFAGREGFGPDFLRALADNDNFGQLDVDEGAQAVQYLIDHNYTQPDKIGIAGCSYGGYYASQSITQYPELYAAANIHCSVLDLEKWWEDNPFLVTFMQGSLPTDNPEEYRRDSPVFQAASIETPLLLFHGTDDDLPIGIVRDFRDGIDETRTPVVMFAFKNEGHQFEQSTSRLYAAQLQIDWFRRYLLTQP